MKRPAGFERAILVFLIAYGAVSVSCGVRNAMRAEESQDLARVYMASRLWVSGYDPYRANTADEWAAAVRAAPMPTFYLPPMNSTLYSPVALMDMSPISQFNWVQAKTLWLGFNLLLAAYVPFVLLRLWYGNWSVHQSARLVALWFGGIGLRVGLAAGQHALFSLACMVTALLLLSKRRPAWAGVPLALSLHKFQLAAFFMLGLLAKRAYRTILAAGGVAIAMVVVFFGRLDVPAAEVIASYVRAFGWQYDRSAAGGIPGVGVTHLYPVIAWAVGHGILSTALLYGLVLASMAVCARAAWMRRSLPTDLEVATWSLLLLWSMYHGVFDTIVLIVPIAALMDRWPRLTSRAARWAGGALMTLLVGMWFTDASRIFLIVHPIALSDLREVGFYRVMSYGYRTALAGLFVAFIALQFREAQRSELEWQATLT